MARESQRWPEFKEHLPYQTSSGLPIKRSRQLSYTSCTQVKISDPPVPHHIMWSGRADQKSDLGRCYDACNLKVKQFVRYNVAKWNQALNIQKKIHIEFSYHDWQYILNFLHILALRIYLENQFTYN